MKKISLAIIAASLFAAGCNSGSADRAAADNTANTPIRAEKMEPTTQHTFENMPEKPAGPVKPTGGKWSAAGDPIDTSDFDKAIADAEKNLKAKPSDAAAKTAAVEAYFKRGFALTEARQYASALGDYRRALKLDPNHEESKKW
ncbi:MAG TPA: tetratricopeptide repeat protein, partial [Pyrinomonadaceae bacterium]|nr:tetratricopeptide repeat protein [Pyrinomonadaceae bacterium]